MMSANRSEIKVGRTRGALVVKVVGGGTIANSLSLRQFLATAFDSGVRSTIFDLSECDYVDSTFMGVLVWAARLAARYPGGAGRIVGAHAQVRDTLQAMRLELVLDISEAPAEGHPRLRSLPTVEGVPQPGLIYEAHQELARITPENRRRFARLLEILEAELDRQENSSQS